MSTSVYPVLGRLKRNVGKFLPSDKAAFSLTAEGIAPEHFEFLDPDSYYPEVNGNLKAHIYDNYHLFSWLAKVRGNLQPLPGVDENKERVLAFAKWLDQGSPTYLDLEWQLGDPTDAFGQRYIWDWRNCVLYPIDYLLSFNYDQVAQVIDTEDESRVIPHPELRTYRELFEGDGYFEFLEEAKAKDWDFIIFTFD